MNRKIELWLCALLTFPVLLLSYFANLPRAAAESTPNENEVVSTYLDDYIDSEPIKIDEAAAAVNERSMGNTSFVGGEENSHIGGITEAVTLRGNYAFIGEGLGLTILDISDPESAHVIGRSLPMPEIAEDIALDGDYAYIADGWGSLRIFDVSSPASPIEVGFIYPDYYRYARGIEVVGNYAYVASARDWTVKHPIVDSKPGLSIVDISDPTTPVEIAFYEIDQNGSPLLSDVAVEKDRAFLSYGPGCVPCTGGLYVFDISKPKSPEVLSTIQLPGFASRINVVDKYAYVSNLRFFRLDDPSGVSGLSIIDIADPANPLDVGFIQTIGQANSVAVLNNRAYVGGGTAGLYVMDISDPTQPQQISEVDTPQNADGVAAAGNFAYVADHAGGLRIINTLDPAAPAETSFYNPAIPTNLTVDSSYAYVTSGESGLRIIDIGDHEHPEEVGMVETPGFAQQVTVQGKTAYVADGTNGMRIISVANPAVPRELGYFDTPGEARAVAVRGNYAFMADGDSGMRIIEVSTPKSPIEVGFFETMITANDIVIDQDLVYLAADTGLYIIDVSNPEKPATISSFDTTGPAVDIVVQDGHAFTACGSSGISIIDITDPAHPVALVEGLSIYTESDVVAVDGDTLYMNGGFPTGDWGVMILNIRDTSAIELVSYYPTHLPTTLTFSDGYTYIAEESAGLTTVRYFGPYKISGYIRQLNESPLEGARVRAGSSYAMTDSKGYYQIIQMQEGKYTVEAELDGYSFYPEKQAISLPPSARDVNFTARIANGMNMVVYQPVVIGP